MKAIYRCLNPTCGMRYEGPPGPTQCPICRGLYIKWENYEEMRKMWDDCEFSKNKE